MYLAVKIQLTSESSKPRVAVQRQGSQKGDVQVQKGWHAGESNEPKEHTKTWGTGILPRSIPQSIASASG